MEQAETRRTLYQPGARPLCANRKTCGCRPEVHFDDRLCTARIDLFGSLTAEEQQSIVANARHLTLEKKEYAFRENEAENCIVIVRFGQIKLSRLGTDGREIIHGFMLEGDVCGENALFGESYYDTDGICTERTGICKIYTDDIEALLMSRPEVGAKIVRRLGRRLQEARKMIDLLSCSGVKERLAGFLIYHMRRTGSKDLHLTREEIGSAIHLSRETVSRRLNEMKREGLIESDGYRHVFLRDVDALIALYESR